MSAPGRPPAVWLPAIRAGTGADVFTRRLCEGLNDLGLRAEIEWIPHHAEYLPWAVAVPRPPTWANVAHVNSWLPRRFWPKGLPVVVTVHHLVHDPAFRPCRSAIQAAYHELLIRRREWRAIRDADTVTTVSDHVRRAVTRFSGLEQVSVISNWIDYDRFRPGPDRGLSGNPSFRLFMAGNLSRRKGSDLLPGFMKELGPGFEVRHAGGHAPAIAGITALGRVSEDRLIREYQTCDAVVSLSRHEGFGYTALEAMACRRPFLGFDTSALPELVTAECGTLVKVDDVAALAAAARALRARPEAATAMGNEGRSRALARYHRGRVEEYVAIYRSLVEGRGPKRELPA